LDGLEIGALEEALRGLGRVPIHCPDKGFALRLEKHTDGFFAGLCGSGYDGDANSHCVTRGDVFVPVLWSLVKRNGLAQLIRYVQAELWVAYLSCCPNSPPFLEILSKVEVVLLVY
jgi:hypothetical protein